MLSCQESAQSCTYGLCLENFKEGSRRTMLGVMGELPQGMPIQEQVADATMLKLPKSYPQHPTRLQKISMETVSS